MCFFAISFGVIISGGNGGTGGDVVSPIKGRGLRPLWAETRATDWPPWAEATTVAGARWAKARTASRRATDWPPWAEATTVDGARWAKARTASRLAARWVETGTASELVINRSNRGGDVVSIMNGLGGEKLPKPGQNIHPFSPP